MPSFNIAEHVNASPQRAFAVFSDFANAPKNISAIKSVEILTDGPIGKGTRFKETRTMFGRDATETMEVTEWNPNGSTPSYTVSADSCGMHIDTIIRFHPEHGGAATRVEMDMQMKAISFFSKVMSPLTGLMMGPTMRKCIASDFADAKKVAESRTD